MELSVRDHRVTIDDDLIRAEPAVIEQQVMAYLAGERERFRLDWRPPEGFIGTVMEAMAQVPYGETRTYGELGSILDSSAVAIGQACGRNPLPLVVPCHRIVAADGLGGYQYPGLKPRLLAMEAGGPSVR